MQNACNNTTIVTIGGSKNPILAIMDKGIRGRMEVIMSGHCPDCGKILVGHNCINHPELSAFH